MINYNYNFFGKIFVEIENKISKYNFENVEIEIKTKDNSNSFILYFKKKVKPTGWIQRWIDDISYMEIQPISFPDRMATAIRVRTEKNENGKKEMILLQFEIDEFIDFVVDRVCDISENGKQIKLSLLKGILA